MAKITPFSVEQADQFKKDFGFPNTWSVENAQFAFNEVRDGTHDSPKDAAEGVPLVTSKNLNVGSIDFNNTKTISLDDHSEISKRSGVKKGDLLFSMIGTIGNVAIVPENTEFSVKNVGLFRANPILLYERYSFFWLLSDTYQRYLDDKKRGGSQKFVSLGILRESPVPIAPLNEQNRIANKLDELLAQVDTIKARVDAIPKIIKRFRQSVLAAAVSGKLTESWRKSNEVTIESWKTTTFDDVCREITVGFVGKMKDQYQESGIPFLRSQNVRAFNFSRKNLLYISEQFHKVIFKSRLESGDLAIVRSGAPGTTCVIPDSLGVANCSDLVIARPSKQLNAHFACIFMNSESGLAHVATNQVGVAQQHFNVGSMKGTEINLPEIKEQNEIVQRVEHLFTFAEQIEQRVKDAQSRVNHLTQSILAKAFRGELVPQDPNDEPAEKLLERIQAERAEAEQLIRAAKKSPTKRQKRS